MTDRADVTKMTAGICTHCKKKIEDKSFFCSWQCRTKHFKPEKKRKESMNPLSALVKEWIFQDIKHRLIKQCIGFQIVWSLEALGRDSMGEPSWKLLEQWSCTDLNKKVGGPVLLALALEESEETLATLHKERYSYES